MGISIPGKTVFILKHGSCEAYVGMEHNAYSKNPGKYIDNHLMKLFGTDLEQNDDWLLAGQSIIYKSQIYLFYSPQKWPFSLTMKEHAQSMAEQ